jgi:hypothetical protein
MGAESLTAERLFLDFFLPLYPEDAAKDLARARATDANPANNPALFAHLHEAASIFAGMAPALFGADLGLDFSDASVHRLGAALTRARRDAWIAKGAAGTAENELFNVVVHAAAYVGACIEKNHGGRWLVRRPLWESLVALQSAAGDAELAVFHWLLKSLADDALPSDGEAPKVPSLADRYRNLVEVPCFDASALPAVYPTDRKLPRLSKVRYDVFYKYIKANLPELRDVGRDFPSPERFDEYGFKWLDFLVLGEGRMLLVAGLTAHGLQLFWLDAAGFQKAAFFAADAFPEPVVRRDGDKLQVILGTDGRTAVHELLWWGP